MTASALLAALLMGRHASTQATLSPAQYAQKIQAIFQLIEGPAGDTPEKSGDESMQADSIAKVVDRIGNVEIELAALNPPADLVPFNEELQSAMRWLGDKLAPLTKAMRSNDLTALDRLGDMAPIGKRLNDRLVLVLDDCGYSGGKDFDFKDGFKPTGRLSTYRYGIILKSLGQSIDQDVVSTMDSVGQVSSRLDASNPSQRRQLAASVASSFERAAGKCRQLQRRLFEVKPPKSLIAFNDALRNEAAGGLAHEFSRAASLLRSGRFTALGGTSARFDALKTRIEARLRQELAKAGFDSKEFEDNQRFKRTPAR